MAITLPDPLIRGTVSARCISDIMSERDPRYEKSFAPGQEILGGYYIPPFQRPAVWTTDQSRKLIESIWLGLPIGSIIVSGADLTMGETFPHTADWIIDGQQRMRALDAYLKKGLTVFVGTPHEHRYDDLERPQQRRLLSTAVGFILLEEANEDALREIYNRLNFSGTHHSADQMA